MIVNTNGFQVIRVVFQKSSFLYEFEGRLKESDFATNDFLGKPRRPQLLGSIKTGKFNLSSNLDMISFQQISVESGEEQLPLVELSEMLHVSLAGFAESRKGQIE